MHTTVETAIALGDLITRNRETHRHGDPGTMYSAAGTSSIYVDSPLERAFRDFRTMQQHVLGQPIWAEDSGRITLGLPPSNPLFTI